jgi:hypothetical protein
MKRQLSQISPYSCSTVPCSRTLQLSWDIKCWRSGNGLVILCVQTEAQKTSGSKWRAADISGTYSTLTLCITCLYVSQSSDTELAYEFLVSPMFPACSAFQWIYINKNVTPSSPNRKSPEVVHRWLCNLDTTLQSNTRVFIYIDYIYIYIYIYIYRCKNTLLRPIDGAGF